jgi:DNA-binding transcriptional MerR regulator
MTYSIKQVEDKLGISRMTIYRYERQGWLTVARMDPEDEHSDRVFTDADLERIQQIREEVKSGMVQKCREVQSERLAAKALKEQRLQRKVSQLEAQVRQSESQIITGRVAAILEAFPDAKADDWELVLTYYRIYHGTENLRAAKAAGAPFPDTITRRKREILKKEGKTA